MPTVAGTVTIDDAGAASGSGLALALYTSIDAIEEAANPLPDPTTPDADWDETPAEWREMVVKQAVKVKRAWAREAKRHADVIAPLFVDPDTTVGKYLLAPVASTLATAVATGLTFPVLAGEVWHVECDLLVSCSGAGGVKLAFDAPAASTVAGGAVGSSTAVTAFTSASLAALGTLTAVAFCTAAATLRVVRAFVVVVAAADGAITLQFAAGTAGQTATIVTGSSMRARKVSGV